MANWKLFLVAHMHARAAAKFRAGIPEQWEMVLLNTAPD